MIRWLVVMLMAAWPALAQDPAPLLLRMTVEQQGPFWLGQRVTVTLTAMTPVRFVDPIAWPDIAVSSGRIIVLPEAATVPGTERVEGRSYAALMRSYAVFPATPGEVALAPLTVTARVGGPDGQPVEASAGVPAVQLSVRAPPGVSDLSRLVVAPSFSLRAQVEGNAATIHVGDAVTRIVTMEADDTASMMLPPAAWQAPEGVRLYPDPPVLQDRSDRGTLHALRRERAAFVPERPGPVTLPGFSVSWFDPAGHRLRQMTVEPLHLEVRPAAAEHVTRGLSRWIWGGIGLFVLLAVGAGLLLSIRRRARASSDLAMLAKACNAGDARAAMTALYRWARGLTPMGGDRSIRHLAERAGVPALAVEATALERCLYGGGVATAWHGAALLSAARAAERALRRHVTVPAGTPLPPLNPTGLAGPPPRLAQPRWAR